MKRRQHVLGDEEQRARYDYLVQALPASVLEHAHSAALEEFTDAQRATVLAVLRPFVLDQGAASPDPQALAAVLGGAAARDAILATPDATAFAARVAETAPVVAYFTTGAGSVAIDGHPPWVQELAGHDGAPLDAATYRRRTIRSDLPPPIA